MSGSGQQRSGVVAGRGNAGTHAGTTAAAGGRSTMRIVISCLQSLRPHRIAACDFWRQYFVNGVQEAGGQSLEVPEVDWAEGITFCPDTERAALSDWRHRTWQRTLDNVLAEHRQQPVDCFLSYLYPQQVDVAAVRELQSAGIPCVNFFCDNVREYRQLPEEFRVFSLHWVPEYEALPMYARAAVRFLHAPMPCWVRPELRGVCQTETEGAVFIGSADVLRRELLGQAVSLGADLRIYGHGWRASERPPAPERPAVRPGARIRNQLQTLRQRGLASLWHKTQNRLRPLVPRPIPDNRIAGPVIGGAEYERITRESSVTIGINRVPTDWASLRRPLTYSRLRDLEAPMMGACYLAEWSEGLGQLYEPGREIETYGSAEELCDKLQYLQRHPELRMRLRQNGQRRALAEHVIPRTLQRIYRELGLPLRS